MLIKLHYSIVALDQIVLVDRDGLSTEVTFKVQSVSGYTHFKKESVDDPDQKLYQKLLSCCENL